MRSRVYVPWPIVNIQYLALQVFTEARSSSLRGLHLTFLRRALKIMLTKCENIGDAVKSLITGLWITFSVCSIVVRGQEGKKKPILC